MNDAEYAARSAARRAAAELDAAQAALALARARVEGAQRKVTLAELALTRARLESATPDPNTPTEKEHP